MAELQTQMDVALEGVSNFRKFQLQNAKDAGYLKALATLWSIIFAIILTVGGFACEKSWPAIRAILQDYYAHHPDVTEQIQHQRGSLEPETAQQHAVLPNMR